MMRKPGTDESNVQMSDVLCDFCHREWTEELPLIEGHHGSCLCGHCLSVAFRQVVIEKAGFDKGDFKCRMCLESSADRAALNRPDEPGWQSPLDPEAFACRRCIKQAAVALERDRDFDWQRPSTA